MKNIATILIAFFIIGCGGGGDGVPINFAKEQLTKQDYYSAYAQYGTNDCIDEFIKYSFKDTTYTKTIYKDSSFSKVKETISDKIEYLTPLNIALYEKGDIFDCTVAIESENNVTLVCLNRAIADKSYSIFRSLFATKEDALKNKKEECSK